MTAGACCANPCPRADTKRYLNSIACPEHAPWAIAGRLDPATQIDPARTEKALRIRPTPIWAKGGTDINKERPGGYVSRQRAQKIAAERDAIREAATS